MLHWQIIPQAEASITTLVQSINKVIINPIIFLLFALAAVYFLYGLAQYLLSPNSEEVRKKSKSVMLWGLIGLFIMVAVFGIMKLILGTLKVNNIKINNAGDYTVQDFGSTADNIADKNLTPNKNTGTDQFGGTIDIQSDREVLQLDEKEFKTDPFPTYGVDNLCWRPDPLHETAGTEFEALQKVTISAQNRYSADTGYQPVVDKFGFKKWLYPKIFDTKILYDKAHKLYYAWIDVRGPKKGGSDKNCNLKVLKPARVIPDGVEQVDVSAQDTPDNIDPKVFVTSPFASYDEKPLECWHPVNPPLYAKASTEFEATNKIKAAAREQYLKDNSILDTNEKFKNYPVIFASKVLYDKKNKLYYSWIDARAPINNKPITACNLKQIDPAPKIPDGALPIDISTHDTEYLPREVFTKAPFPTYEENKLCWHKVPPAYKTTIEYDGLDTAMTDIRKQFLDENKTISKTDEKYKKYPIIFDSKILYDSVEKLYYTWIDARAPINGGDDSKCNLKITKEADPIPDGATPIDLRSSTDPSITNISKQRIPDALYEKSPFTQKYIPSKYCWRGEVMAKADTEFGVNEQIKKNVRKEFIDKNHLVDAETDPKIPIAFGSVVTYNKKNKTYYAWWDARGPLKGATMESCKLILIGNKRKLPDLTPASEKQDPFDTTYESNASYWRVVESAVAPIYDDARDMAINNGLIQLAAFKGLTTINNLKYRIIDESYYGVDPVTGQYDYWVVMESPK